MSLLYQTDQGVKCVATDKAEQLAGSDPDYNNRMLYNAIANGMPVSFILRCYLILPHKQ